MNEKSDDLWNESEFKATAQYVSWHTCVWNVWTHGVRQWIFVFENGRYIHAHTADIYFNYIIVLFHHTQLVQMERKNNWNFSSLIMKVSTA